MLAPGWQNRWQNSVLSCASSSPGHSTPIARNCTICAARDLPGAPNIPAIRTELFRLFEAALQLDFLTRFLHANRSHPRIKSVGMLRSKTLFVRLRCSRLRATMATFPDGHPAVILAINGPFP